MRSPCSTLILLAVGAVVALPAPVRAAPPELKKIHVLMVFDDDDRHLRDSLRLDAWRMKRFVREHFPEDRHTTAELLNGAKVTRDNILDAVKNLAVKEREGIFFFYGGHGALDSKKRHHFKLTHGKSLARDELRQALEAKKAELVVILTDCCSNLPKLDPREDELENRKTGQAKQAIELRPTIRHLFFQARGTVDVTAATEDASWCDRERGGIFTRAICRMLDRSVKELDVNRDGFVTWQEFFPQLRKDTELDFASWSKQMSARGEEGIDSRTQKPFAFHLGATDTYAVVGIENAMKNALPYEYRWSGQGEWQKASLAQGEKRHHFLKLDGPDTAPPSLHVRSRNIEGGTITMKAKRWTGQVEPRYTDAARYRIRPPKGSTARDK
jgi:hypothetical protein